MDLSDLTGPCRPGALECLAGVPVVLQDHHTGLLLDQTVDDALGHELGWELRRDAAHAAWLPLLARAVEHLRAHTPVERLIACQDLFWATGHGRMALDATADGGTAEGEFLLHGTAWTRAYGQRLRRHHPADAVAAGFASAAAQVASRSDRTLVAEETACVATHASRCTFRIVPGGVPSGRQGLAADLAEAEPAPGIGNEAIASLHADLRRFTSGLAGDHRGLIEAFDVFLSRPPTNYANAVAHGAVDAIRARSPALVPVVEGLLRECGHRGAFHTLGGVLRSPEWTALVGPIPREREAVAMACCAIARSLGYGAYSVEEIGDDRLVLVASAEFESPWCRVVRADRCPTSSWFMQGAAIALLELATRVDWSSTAPLTDAFAAFAEPAWVARQTESLAVGDAVSRVVVERRPS